MNDNDLFWLAGYLEAEGSFVKGPPSRAKYSRISAHSTDCDVIERVASLFEVTYINTRNHADKKNWKPVHQVILNSKPAVRMMLSIYPLMGNRRKLQIRNAISGYDPKLVPQVSEESVIPPEYTLYWLAGYLEGEGSFIPGPPTDPYRPRVQSWTTDEDVASKLAVMLNTHIRTQYQRQGGDYKTAYPIAIRGRNAAEWMHKLRPLMGSRRQSQIDRALEKFDPNRKGGARGAANTQTKLNETQVRDIRRRLSDGATMISLAREYGLAPASIRDIRNRRSWGWLED